MRLVLALACLLLVGCAGPHSTGGLWAQQNLEQELIVGRLTDAERASAAYREVTKGHRRDPSAVSTARGVAAGRSAYARSAGAATGGGGPQAPPNRMRTRPIARTSGNF